MLNKTIIRAPGPKGHFLLGNLMDVRRDRLEFVLRITGQYGDIVRFRMGHKTLHLINHPDYVKQVLLENSQNYKKGLGLSHAKPLLGNGLLTSEGEFWQHQRKLILPAFHRKKMDDFFSVMKQEIELMLKRWEVQVSREAAIDVYKEMMQLTLTILGRTLFSIDLTNKTDKLAQSFSLAVKEAIHRMTAMFELSSYFPTPRNLRFRKALKILDAFIYDLINQRRQGQKSNNNADLLSMLLLATDEKTEKKMNDKQLRDEIVTMLLAGHETTALALTWSVYLLARHPKIQDTLRNKIKSFDAPQDFSYEQMAELKYSRLVLDEAMRLYPPVWLIPRRAIGSDNIGGFHIPRKSEVLICVYALHRHPAFWKEPNSFLPERFISDEERRSKYAYLPFGAGPRTCIGNHFGLIEAQLALSMIVQKYIIGSKGGQEEIKPDPILTLRPKARIQLELVPVKNNYSFASSSKNFT